MLNEAVYADDAGRTAAALDAGASPSDIIGYRRPGNPSPFRDEAWFVAAALGAARAMSVMLCRGGVQVEERARDGGTALHWAALYGQPEAVKLLLAAGADAEAEAEGGVPPSGMTLLRRARGVSGVPAERDAAVRALLAGAAGRDREGAR